MNSRKLVTRLIVFLFLVSAGAPVLVGLSVPKAEEFTKIVNYPLPSVPEPVLSGGDLRVEVKAGSDVSGWSARLFSRFGASELEFLNSSLTNDLWTLYFKAPTGLPPGLYDLDIEYVVGSDIVQYTQSRCVWLQDEWPDSITISHISDLHEQHGRDPIAQYINEVNLMDPDLIIASGDIVQTETVAAGWDYLYAQLELLDVPSYLLPGNHDHAGGSSLIYQRFAGPLNYSVAFGDFLILTLDSHLTGQDWINQFQWVESELDKHSEKTKILAWHHPILGFEIEDLEGKPSGYNITGSWEDLEPFEDIVYRGWRWGPDLNATAFKDLLRIIQVYDVRLILNGHIHYDIIHILNNRHYFIDVGPVGGGLPPGQYHGSRLITIDSNGNIDLDWYASNNTSGWPNSIPVEGLTNWYSSANDWSESAVTATVVNDLEMPINDARLEFRVSDGSPVEGYTFSVEPNEYDVYTVDEGYIFVSYFDVDAGDRLDVTLSAGGDSQSPEILLDLSDYGEGEPLTGTVTAMDGGWGVDGVAVYYRNDVTPSWTSIELPFSPTINGDVYDITYPEAVRTFAIPAQAVTSGLVVKVEATDHAGNPAIFETADLSTPPVYTLSVDTDPSGIAVTVDGGDETSPYTGEHEAGSYELSVPDEVEFSGKNYTFSGWDDGYTGSSRTLSLDEDTSLVASYEEVVVEEPPEEPDEPVEETEEPDEPEEEPDKPAGIPLPTSYVLIGLLLSVCLIYLLSRR